MYCGLLASAASTLSTAGFDASTVLLEPPWIASKLSRLLPICKRARRRVRLGGRCLCGGERQLRQWANSHLHILLQRRLQRLRRRLKAGLRMWQGRASEPPLSWRAAQGAVRTLPTPALPAPAPPARPRFEMSPRAARARVETAGPMLAMICLRTRVVRPLVHCSLWLDRPASATPAEQS